MTAAELASLLRARRCGKGRWVAKCPAHDDRTPSLSIAEGKKVPVVIKCMSAGCDPKSIMEAAGLKWGDLFNGAPGAELKGRLADERRLEKLDKRFGLVLWMLAIDKAKRNYWLTAAKRVGQERRDLREKLNPKLKTEREFQEKVNRLGWDAVWEEWIKANEEKIGVD